MTVVVRKEKAMPPSTDTHITYQLQYRKCGKATCSTCCDGHGHGHGPYWYAYWREGTRLRSGYIGKVKPAELGETDEASESAVRPVL